MSPRLALAIISFIGALNAAAVRTESQEASSSSPLGILGGTVSELSTRRPISGVVVRATRENAVVGRQAVTDANGRFLIDRLPFGRISLSASKPGYVRPAWRPGQGPQTYVIAGEGQVSDVGVDLEKGAVITGVVTDPHGRGVEGAKVTALGCRPAPSPCNETSRRLVASARTDDGGRYRVFGLAAGTYVVVVDAQLTLGSEVSMPSDVAIRWADGLVRSGNESAPPARVIEAARSAPAVSYVSTYFPGVTSFSQAARLELIAGDDRSGADVQVQLGASARIRGTVFGPDGRAEAPNNIFIYPFARVTGVAPPTSLMASGDGSFVTAPLPPGDYRLVARTSGRGQPMCLSTIFGVSGVEVDNVAANLRPCAAVSGIVTVESGGPSDRLAAKERRVEFRRLDVPLLVSSVDLYSAVTGADGGFTVPAMVPGRYSVTVAPLADATRELMWLMSVSTESGVDVTDVGLEVPSEGLIRGLAIRLSDRAARIGGSLFKAGGEPAADYMVIAFPVDRRLRNERRTAIVQVAANGSFLTRPIAPGDYFIGAAGVSTPDDVDGPLLESLESASVKVTIGEGERRQVQIMIRTPLGSPIA